MRKGSSVMKVEDTHKTKSNILKTSVLAVVVVALHVVAIGGFFTIQGCGTPGAPQAVEPAPAPVMPPRVVQDKKAPQQRATIRKPLPVKPAPAVKMTSSASEMYTIQKGDSLGAIAQRFGVSSRELAEINGIKNPNLIRVGQKLVLPPYAKKQLSPVTSEKRQAHSTSKSTASTMKKAAPGSVYVVQPGDVLSRIAVRHGTTVRELREANKLSSDRIIVGQKLTIPGGKTAVSSTSSVSKPAVPAKPAPKPVATVASAPAPVKTETIVIDEMASTDDVDEVSAVAVEEVAAPVAPSVPEQAFYYSVIEGDTLEKVAMTFGLLKEELMKANNLSEDIDLKPGQRLIIPIP